MSDREYVRYAVVNIGPEFELETILDGLVFYSQAIDMAQKLYWRGSTNVAVVSESVSRGMEEERSASIHECQTERVLKEDDHGTYWFCPVCDKEDE